MTLPPSSSPDPSRQPGDRPTSTSANAANDDDRELELALAEVRQAFTELEERYQQIQRDRQRQEELRDRQQHLQQQAKQAEQRNRTQELRAELKRLEQALETIELNLESRLFSWGSLREPFWQAVRFGGLGVVVGWILRSCS